MYLYNNAYSQVNTVKSFISEPITWTEEEVYDTRIKSSQSKINGEISDSWLDFLVNDFIDIDTKYGPINNIKEFNNKLLYWQDNAFGAASVNPRSLVSDGDIGALVLGTGGVLERYDNISTVVGNTNKQGITQTMLGLYWIDNSLKEIYKYSDSLQPLATIKGMKSYINGLTITDVKTGFNKKYNELLLTIKAGNSTDTLVYSENEAVFSSFYDIDADFYIQTDNNTSYIEDGTNSPYVLDAGDRSTFNDTIYESTLSVLVNDKYPVTKVFDNIIMSTTVKSIIGRDQFDDTFNYIRVYNDYQNSDWRTLIYKTVVADVDLAYERRDRDFTLAIPRTAMNEDMDTNPNIFDDDNLDVTQTFKERIRDKYAMVEFKYSNTDGYSFSVPYIRIKYRTSIR